MIMIRIKHVVEPKLKQIIMIINLEEDNKAMQLQRSLLGTLMLLRMF